LKTPPYLAAQQLAASVHPHFAAYWVAARPEPGARAPLPAEQEVAALIDAAFWASLRREEGFVPKISLALLPPEQSASPLRFARPVSLTAADLARLAPAVERPGIHLGVWLGEGGLSVWGSTRLLPPYCLVIEVVAPGLLVVKHSPAGHFGKFVNVAVLEGHTVKLVDQRVNGLSEGTVLAGLPSAMPREVLVQLAASIRTHGRGGILLIVPTQSESWRTSIIEPIRYAVSPPFSGLAEVVHQVGADRRHAVRLSAVVGAVEMIAGLTAVDGATVISQGFEVLAFGAKIKRRGPSPVDRVLVSEPVTVAIEHDCHPEELGGTRHISASQFVYDQRDAFALVASQDGRFTVLWWSPERSMVRAQRLEMLLL
jgi:hypothetical protein